MNKEYLFVYGTLRRDFGLALMDDLAGELEFCGHGNIKAALYDLGAYPAAVKGGNGDEIRGDVYKLNDASDVLLRLDEYEGSEYNREISEVATEAGNAVNAWVYWYTGDTGAAAAIEEEDYLIYLKNKKDSLV